MNRVASIAAVLAGASAATFIASSCTRRAEGAAVVGVPTVAVARIGRGDISQTLTVAAAFKPFQEIEVHAKVSGYLKTISVDVGDHVKAGQLLAILEVPELEDDVQQDDANVKRAEDEINRAQADLERAQSAHDVVHVAAERLGNVRKARPTLVAQQDIDEATGRDRVAEAQVATAKAALASANQQLDIAKAVRKKTGTLAAYSQITAPFAGVVTRRYADTGAMIQAGTSSQTQAMPVVTLSDNSRLRLVIPVPESAVSRIHTGGAVELRVEAVHKTLTGTVARFADRLDTDTRTMRVEVDVDNPDFSLVPGMYADASLVLDEATHVVVAPVEAVDQSEGTVARVVLVNANHQVEPRDVTLGIQSGDRVEIASGVAEGDLVVVGNRSQLKAGTVVSPKTIDDVRSDAAGRGAK
jgi:RND family efflux transporter MFP subunit